MALADWLLPLMLLPTGEAEGQWPIDWSALDAR